MPHAAHYRLYGITLRSAEPLPCPHAPDGSTPDVVLTAAPARDFSAARDRLTAADTVDGWFWTRLQDDGQRYLRWGSLFEFLVSPGGRSIRYRALEQGTPESLVLYLLGPVLSFSLVAFGLEPLHGTATGIDGAAVVFLGESGYGKSTLAAALLAAGYPVVTDDLVALARQAAGWGVHPGIPRLKLFPATAARLMHRAAGEPRVHADTSKLALKLTDAERSREVVPLKRVYVLQPPEADVPRGHEVRIEPLPTGDAFFAIVSSAYNLVVTDRARIANQFQAAASLARTVPVHRLSYPRRFSSLAAVCDAVLAETRAAATT